MKRTVQKPTGPQWPPLPRLRAARKKAKLSLEKLAAEVGISQSQLSRAESGHRRLRLDEAQLLAERLSLSVTELGYQPGDLPSISSIDEANLRNVLVFVLGHRYDEEEPELVSDIILEFAKGAKPFLSDDTDGALLLGRTALARKLRDRRRPKT